MKFRFSQFDDAGLLVSKFSVVYRRRFDEKRHPEKTSQPAFVITTQLATMLGLRSNRWRGELAEYQHIKVFSFMNAVVACLQSDVVPCSPLLIVTTLQHAEMPWCRTWRHVIGKQTLCRIWEISMADQALGKPWQHSMVKQILCETSWQDHRAKRKWSPSSLVKQEIPSLGKVAINGFNRLHWTKHLQALTSLGQRLQLEFMGKMQQPKCADVTTRPRSWTTTWWISRTKSLILSMAHASKSAWLFAEANQRIPLRASSQVATYTKSRLPSMVSPKLVNTQDKESLASCPRHCHDPYLRRLGIMRSPQVRTSKVYSVNPSGKLLESLTTEMFYHLVAKFPCSLYEITVNNMVADPLLVQRMACLGCTLRTPLQINDENSPLTDSSARGTRLASACFMPRLSTAITTHHGLKNLTKLAVCHKVLCATEVMVRALTTARTLVSTKFDRVLMSVVTSFKLIIMWNFW